MFSVRSQVGIAGGIFLRYDYNIQKQNLPEGSEKTDRSCFFICLKQFNHRIYTELGN